MELNSLGGILFKAGYFIYRSPLDYLISIKNFFGRFLFMDITYVT